MGQQQDTPQQPATQLFESVFASAEMARAAMQQFTRHTGTVPTSHTRLQKAWLQAALFAIKQYQEHAAPSNSGMRSDSKGTFSADVPITDAWSVGTHTLTARDGSLDSPKNSVSVTIVQPGHAHTPGPHGAPPTMPVSHSTLRFKERISLV